MKFSAMHLVSNNQGSCLNGGSSNVMGYNQRVMQVQSPILVPGTIVTKGLLNGPGQNNCFLNCAVQVSAPKKFIIFPLVSLKLVFHTYIIYLTNKRWICYLTAHTHVIRRNKRKLSHYHTMMWCLSWAIASFLLLISLYKYACLQHITNNRLVMN